MGILIDPKVFDEGGSSAPTLPATHQPWVLRLWTDAGFWLDPGFDLSQLQRRFLALSGLLSCFLADKGLILGLSPDLRTPMCPGPRQPSLKENKNKPKKKVMKRNLISGRLPLF